MVISSVGDKRTRILDAALRLHLRYGIRRTTIDDVAREAGIAKGTLYLYYDSKDALNAAVLETFFADILANGRRALAQRGTLVERVVAYLEACKGAPMRMLRASPHMAELMESKMTAAPAIYAAFDADMRAELARALRADGIVRDDGADMLCAAAIGSVWTGEPTEAGYRARLEPMVRLLIDGMRA